MKGAGVFGPRAIRKCRKAVPSSLLWLGAQVKVYLGKHASKNELLMRLIGGDWG